MELTAEQRRRLEKLWFVYGNNGKKSNMSNHKFIQGFLERNTLNIYPNVTKECYEAVGQIIDLKAMEKVMRKDFSAGDFVYYTTKQGDTVPAKVVKAFPKTVVITGNFIAADRTVRVSKSNVELQNP